MVPIEPRAHRIDARGHIADPDARPIEIADLWTQIAVRTRNLRPNLSADSESARKTGLETYVRVRWLKKNNLADCKCAVQYSRYRMILIMYS